MRGVVGRCGGGWKAAAWALAGAAAGAELQKRWGLLVAGSARDAQAGEAALAQHAAPVAGGGLNAKPKIAEANPRHRQHERRHRAGGGGPVGCSALTMPAATALRTRDGLAPLA